MVEYSPNAIFYFPQVLQVAVVHDDFLRHLGRMEYNKKSPRTLDDYMSRSAQFGFGRIRP